MDAARRSPKGELDLLYVTPERIVTQGFSVHVGHRADRRCLPSTRPTASRNGAMISGPITARWDIWAKPIPAAAHRADGDRRPAHARGHHRKLGLRRRGVHPLRLTGPTSPTRSSSRTSRASSFSVFGFADHKGLERGIVYCLSRAKVEGHREWDQQAGDQGQGLPRRHGPRQPRSQSGRLLKEEGPVAWSPPSPSAWGNRQAQCGAMSHISICRGSVEASITREDRPGRPRTACLGCLDDLRPWPTSSSAAA